MNIIEKIQESTPIQTTIATGTATTAYAKSQGWIDSTMSIITDFGIVVGAIATTLFAVRALLDIEKQLHERKNRD